ncbi:MAG: metal-sensing transcriptional repressor [Rubrivivax sp.]|nr:metal-sensing transcriptional repressor [Rubrivivax sp.]
MSRLADAAHRTELLNRLRRAEGHLRGIQRMVEEGEGCMDIARQMDAVRRAVDSAYARMAVCFMEEQLRSRVDLSPRQRDALGAVLEEVQKLLGKVR